MKTNKLIFSILSIILLVTFSSCSKTINGHVVDNFGQPLDSVVIKVHETEFKTTSNSNGEFKLDYAAGKFIITFEKDIYLPIVKELEITEKQNYPLENIEMIRLPKVEGVYIQVPGNSDYIQVPKGNYQTKVEAIRYNYSVDRFTNLIAPPIDSVFTIKVRSLDNIRIFDCSTIPLVLSNPRDNNIVAKVKRVYTAQSVTINNLVKETISSPSKYVHVRQFKPEFNQIYAYVNTNSGSSLSATISDRSYVFKFVQE